KIIAQNTGLSTDFRFSTYVARHSWATILKRKGISTSMISEGLGHANEQVTQIYLDSFENEALDEMNKKLLG
ncbi:MAG: tyrosine-type recombinase/integrase, partial [Desulfobacterales bacterium]|nr:tyrosine-type recombinase/integrase [Desulfobacterales bacterium]